MYLYADRILIQVLAFSVGPLLGLLTTAFSNPWLGMFLGILGFAFTYFQPFFSDICLKNTALALNINEVILAEGKVTYESKNTIIQGKLFLNTHSLVFVVNNSVDFSLALKGIIGVEIENGEINTETINQLTSILERKSPNLPQFTTLVNQLAENSSGVLKITVKQKVFVNTYYFEVSNPFLWVKKLKQLI
jgi:hypothetical protein